MKKMLILAITLATPLAQADMYAYVDHNGIKHVESYQKDCRYKLVMKTPMSKAARAHAAKRAQRLDCDVLPTDHIKPVQAPRRSPLPYLEELPSKKAWKAVGTAVVVGVAAGLGGVAVSQARNRYRPTWKSSYRSSSGYWSETRAKRNARETIIRRTDKYGTSELRITR